MSNRGERIVKRAVFVMGTGKARSWSHALKLAAEAERDAATPEAGESPRAPQASGEK
jgi:hypothetical protein